MCTLECKSYYHLGLDHITSSSWMSRQFTSNTPLHGPAVITARTVSTSEVTESVTRALLAQCTFADMCFAAVRRPCRGMKGRVDTRHYEGIWHQTLSDRGPIKKSLGRFHHVLLRVVWLVWGVSFQTNKLSTCVLGARDIYKETDRQLKDQVSRASNLIKQLFLSAFWKYIVPIQCAQA